MSLAFPAPATASLPEPEAACAHTRRGKWGEAQVTPATRPGGEAAVLASARGSENPRRRGFSFCVSLRRGFICFGIPIRESNPCSPEIDGRPWAASLPMGACEKYDHDVPHGEVEVQYRPALAHRRLRRRVDGKSRSGGGGWRCRRRKRPRGVANPKESCLERASWLGCLEALRPSCSLAERGSSIEKAARVTRRCSAPDVGFHIRTRGFGSQHPIRSNLLYGQLTI